MKKQKIMALGIVCLVMASIGIVAAAKLAVGDSATSAVPIESTTVAQKCWQMSPYIDVLKETISAGGQNFLLDGTEGASGYYVLNNAGNMYKDPNDGLLHYGISQVHDGTYFSGAQSIVMWGTINPGTLAGDWHLRGINVPYTVDGTLTPITCPPGPYAPDANGKAAGSQ